MKKVPIANFCIGPNEPLALMCGPCVIESRDHSMKAAEFLSALCNKLKINFIFKSSYDKANRTSDKSFRGPGIQEGLKILQEVKETFDVPIVTDIHTAEEAVPVAEICDIIQIPAFLCRQTDLVVSAAKTGAVISVKKGQFLAPWDMKNIVNKITSCNNENIILVDRGTSFGYNNLVSDMRSIPIMQSLGFPVCFDATHSVQLPGGLGEKSGGQREFIPILAKSAIAAGANCLFMEAHDNPVNAKSDASSVLDFKELPHLLVLLKNIYEVINK